jgi:hypothetical protein
LGSGNCMCLIRYFGIISSESIIKVIIKVKIIFLIHKLYHFQYHWINHCNHHHYRYGMMHDCMTPPSLHHHHPIQNNCITCTLCSCCMADDGNTPLFERKGRDEIVLLVILLIDDISIQQSNIHRHPLQSLASAHCEFFRLRWKHRALGDSYLQIWHLKYDWLEAIKTLRIEECWEYWPKWFGILFHYWGRAFCNGGILYTDVLSCKDRQITQ